jgi:hypothetical protein
MTKDDHSKRLFSQIKRRDYFMDKKLRGMAEIEEYIGLQTVSILEMKRDFDLPIEKDRNSIWHATAHALDRWLHENGLKSWREFSRGKMLAARVRKLRKGPGKVITGDMNQICDKLGIGPGTFITVRTMTGCPIKQVEGTNQFEVDANRWADFEEDRAAAYRGRGELWRQG